MNHKGANITENNKRQEAVGDHDKRERDAIYLTRSSLCVQEQVPKRQRENV